MARSDYNTAATTWNIKISRIPQVFIARLLGFEKAALFDAVAGAETAPEINFDFE